MNPDWVIAMQKEVNQFERNNVWKLVPRPKNKFVIRTVGFRWLKTQQKRKIKKLKSRNPPQDPCENNI